MKILGLSVAVIALLAVASIAHAELALHVPGDSIEDAIEDIHADPIRDMVFTVHWEGRVEARDETDGSLAWAWRFTEEALFEAGAAGERWAGTTAHGFDLVADADAVYVSLIEEKDGLSQPVVALDKDTGILRWFLDPGQLAEAAGFVPPTSQGPAVDAYGLAIDPTDVEDWLYIGTSAGYIFKVDRNTGEPALEPGTLDPLVYEPAFKDVPKVPRPTKTKDTEPYGCSRESRIHSLDAYQGTFIAARNWGGADKQFNCHHLLATSTNNTIIWGTTSDLVGYDLSLPKTDQIEGTPVARPGIREVNVIHDPQTDALDAVLGGEATGSSGYLTVLHDFPYGSVPPLVQGFEYPAGMREAFTFHDEDLPPPGPEDANLTELGPGTAITGVAIDDNYVYAVTRENDTSTFPTPGPSTAWMIKLDRNTLQPATGSESWSSIDVQGNERPARSVEPGATASDITLDPDGPAWVGHSPGASQWPDVGGFYQARGSLLLEVPRDDQSIAVWRMSNGGEFSNGFLPFAYITDYPSADEPDLEARIEYREERPGQAPGTWKPLGEIRQNAVPANSYQQLNNVQLPGPFEMPDSVYRFRVHVEDDAGRIYTDESDGVLTLDRMAPALKVDSPYDPAHPQHLVTVQTNQPSFKVSLSDSFTGIDPLATGIWIDDMTQGYPFLHYTFEEGRVTGFTMDLASADPNAAAVPTTLAEGQHTVRVEAWDKAGNFAFEQWVINVDTTIRAPKFAPSSGVWQATARPAMTAQFYEPGIEVVEAKLDGVDVTDRATHIPQQQAQNPEGTQIRVIPPTPLANDQAHTLSLKVRDAAGNIGGPFLHVVKIDTLSPVIAGLTPEPELLLGEARPEIGFAISDVGAGIRFDSLRVTLDGFSMADKIPSSSDTVLFRPDAPLTDGVHTVKVTVKDLAGNARTEQWSFRVDRTAPLVEVDLKLPTGQSAIKDGDKLIVKAYVQDASELESVLVDASGLRPTGSGELEMLPVPGQPGDYEAVIDVTQSRTKAIEIKVKATDAGGLTTTVGYTVLVDNQAPVVFLEDLPSTSVGTFMLSWQNTPGDAAAGGSGVAYYKVEQQAHGQPWQVAADQVKDTTWVGRYAENQGSTLRFRVTAFDHAGNQGDASNTVETFAKGDPFAELLVSEVLRTGQSARFTATPVDGAALDNTTARIILESDGETFTRALELKGRIFVGEWNMTDVPAGPYRLYFEFDDGQGLLARASARDVTVLKASEPIQEVSAPKDTPGVGAALLVGVLGAAAVIRRKPRD